MLGTSPRPEFSLEPPLPSSKRRSSWSRVPQNTGSDGSGKHGATSEWIVLERLMPVGTPSPPLAPPWFDIWKLTEPANPAIARKLSLDFLGGVKLALERETCSRRRENDKWRGKVWRKFWDFLAKCGADCVCVVPWAALAIYVVVKQSQCGACERRRIKLFTEMPWLQLTRTPSFLFLQREACERRFCRFFLIYLLFCFSQVSISHPTYIHI